MVYALLLLLFPLTSALDVEVGMTTPQLIRRWGYPVEIHKAVTVDGYILELHRIPFGRNEVSGGCRPVIFFQHGLLSDSEIWVANTPPLSPGFIMADAGFDVWLGNIRGNDYSNKHVSLSPKEQKFWDFTWDDMSGKDLDAMIDTALNVSNAKSLYYVGHSQGTVIMFSKLSHDRVFAKKIRKFFALAPIQSMRNAKGLFKCFADLVSPILPLMYKIFGKKQFRASSPAIYAYATKLCAPPNMGGDSNIQMFLLAAGPTSGQFNISRMPIYASMFPSGTSTRNMEHWVQMIGGDGYAHAFDYGQPRLNIERYGTPIPPIYNYTKVATDMYLYWANEDFIADPADIREYLIPNLNPAYVKGNFHLAGYNHFDFVWGTRSPLEIYAPIIGIIRRDFTKQECVKVIRRVGVL